MFQAYVSPPAPSTDDVSPRQWRRALLLLALVGLGGAALTLALALGMADPPRAGDLTWETNLLDGWALVHDLGGSPRLWLHQAPVEYHVPPFTLEVEAAVANGAAWGLWVERRDTIDRVPTADYLFLVGYDDYISAGTSLDWHNFMHVQPAANRLYLHVEADGAATFRVNSEIAWRGQLDLAGAPAWGIALMTSAHFDLHAARLYVP